MKVSHTVVVGGGVIGACTAYYLAKRGQRVTLLEQNELCSGSSLGNAGQITPGHLPLPQPGMATRNIRWLFKRTSPLYVKPRCDLELFDWLLRFARACTPRHLRRSTELLCRLGDEAYQLFDELASEFDFRLRKKGRLEVCRSEKSLAGTQKEARLLEHFGFESQVLTGAEVNAFEPAIICDVAGAVYYPESGDCDPEQFVLQTICAAKRLGAEVRENTEVLALQSNPDSSIKVLTQAGEITADSVVLACGAWRGPKAHQLGLRMPIQPGKGYHLDVERPDPCPTHPVVFVEEKIFINPFDDVLRLAGTMEMSGFNLHQEETRLDMLAIGARRYFTDHSALTVRSRWCHWRPMTPDGLPVIGPTPNNRRVWVATGHGMLGLTQGPITGRLLAEWILDGQPSIDLSMTRANRF